MKPFLRSIKIAFIFLTRIPFCVPDWQEADAGKSAVWYPLVGVVIGFFTASVFCLCSLFLPSTVCAVVAVALWVALSGGLHLDGLADCFDGFTYAGCAERRLEIMKDPRMGAMGGIGLFFALAFKISLLATLPIDQIFWVLPLSAALGRWNIFWVVRFPLANPNGLAAMLKKHLNPKMVWIAAVFPMSIVFFGGLKALALFLVAGAVAWWISALAKAKIGGINGDVIGLNIEMTEILCLFCVLILVRL